jgi:OOP family OmpA-OmpF porin
MHLPKPSIIAIIAIALLPISILRAQEPFVPGFYAGASLGGTKFDFSLYRPTVYSDATYRDTHLAWKVNAGYQFSPKWGIELGYVDLGRVDYRSEVTVVTGLPPLRSHGGIDTTALTLAGTATLPLGDRFGLFAKLGAYDWKSSTDDAVSQTTYRDRSTNAFAGLGLNYKLTPKVSLVLESEHFLGDERNLVVSSGLRFRF